MDVRALEPEDLAALAALCERPELAAELDELPDARKLQTAPGVHAALGAFENGKLIGAAGMSAVDRPRLRHVGRAWVAADPRPAGPLLEALATLALDWWKLDRLELALPAHSRLHEVVSPRFEREVVRRADLAYGETLVDRWDYALIRPGASSTVARRAFPRGAHGPLPDDFEIRPTRPDDAPAFARLLGEPSVAWGTLQVPLTPDAVWKARLSANDPARNKLFVALVDGVQVGNCGLHGAVSPRRLHVWSMGMTVATAWQGRGVGRALMQRLVSEADALRIPRVELDVYTDNTRAIALYEKFGFVREGVRRLEAWRDGAYADALVMARLR